MELSGDKKWPMWELKGFITSCKKKSMKEAPFKYTLESSTVSNKKRKNLHIQKKVNTKEQNPIWLQTSICKRSVKDNTVTYRVLKVKML